ncbi:MAG: hypothetical protein LBG42_07120 [Treponema sp.]|jgi:hypothetical protein|nr:hypothetical protein [Treponema sp.]
MMKMRKCFFLSGALLPLFVSCTAGVQGRLAADGSGEFAVSTSLEPRTAALIRSLKTMGGSSAGTEAILDGEGIARSMSSAPGVRSVSFRNTGSRSIEGPLSISRIGDFLAPAGGKGGFITLEQGAGGVSRLAVVMNRASAPEILSLVSAEVSDYLAALMAPLVTGEELTKTEYLSLVASIYGQGTADEIARGTIQAAVDFPGQVNSVRGGSRSGKRAEFTVPLLDVLVLETPLSYEVTWTP